MILAGRPSIGCAVRWALATYQLPAQRGEQSSVRRRSPASGVAVVIRREQAFRKGRNLYA